MRVARRAGIAALMALGLVALSGCASDPGEGGDGSQADRVVRGIPDGWSGPQPDPLGGVPVVGWVDDDEFGVITMGSGSCPAVAQEPEVVSDAEIRIDFGPSPYDPCTADMAATTHVFVLPDQVTGRPVTVTVTYLDFDEEYVLELS